MSIQAAPGSEWDKFSKRLDGHIDKARRAAFFLEAYAMDTGGKKVKPTGEIQKAEETVAGRAARKGPRSIRVSGGASIGRVQDSSAQVATAKAEIRKILKEVAEMYPDHRWGTEKAEVKGAGAARNTRSVVFRPQRDRCRSKRNGLRLDARRGSSVPDGAASARERRPPTGLPPQAPSRTPTRRARRGR